MLDPHARNSEIKLFNAISHCDSIGGRIFTPKTKDENLLLLDWCKFLIHDWRFTDKKIGIAIYYKKPEGKWIDAYTNQPPTSNYYNWEDETEYNCEENAKEARF